MSEHVLLNKNEAISITIVNKNVTQVVLLMYIMWSVQVRIRVRKWIIAMYDDSY